ncbi:hypothetical protein BKA93DRAFT_734225, partial [Sparassis latifolia]
YVSVQQYTMFQKAMVFNDESVGRKILDTTDPKQLQGLGRAVTGFDSTIWAEGKLLTFTLHGGSRCLSCSTIGNPLKGFL